MLFDELTPSTQGNKSDDEQASYPKQVNINGVSPSKYAKLECIATDKGMKVSTMCRMWIYERLNKERLIMFDNPMAITMWQFIFAYKLEAANEIYNFTDEQKQELLDLMDMAEDNHKSLRPGKIHKMNMAFHNFDKKFEEYGGNIDNLSAKVDEISSKLDSRMVKLGEAIMEKPQLLTKLKVKRS